jgi:hypothetical protein
MVLEMVYSPLNHLTWLLAQEQFIEFKVSTITKPVIFTACTRTRAHTRTHTHTHTVWQKYLTIWQHNCEWNRWYGEFVLERSSSETESISVAMEHWSVKHRVFAVEMIFKNNNSVVVTQLIFRRHFNIHRNECP